MPFDPAEFPAWLHDDVVMANRSIDEAYKPSRGELDFAWINEWHAAAERLLVYRVARRQPGRFVTVGRYTMRYAPEAPL